MLFRQFTSLAILSITSLLTVCLAGTANAETPITKIKVACVGDSITFGSGIADRDNVQLSRPVAETSWR